ncbi:glutathione S-transferase Mu 3 isoform X1 [Marmota monax]|uniref:glutathione S-transferase Mu 3 isoform X1 n=1 Tax=Marmota monax TaxID=9995 RepID=UPI001EB08D4D|nr:glutathione S-transferase Mu 3 isoform X1 [Marmota monax]XP_048671092.1 glutathione S-transferase Mu 3 isoform X2 [Marmota marmota marmota]
MSSTSSMVLGYWDIRGLAHAIRLLLEFTDTSYEEKRYICGEAPDYDRSQWLDVKFKLDLDFPNLPYLMDGNNKITQSNAILRYIARKHNMCGDTEEEKIRVDIMENQIMDFRMQLIRLCYNSDHEKMKPQYLEQLPGQLKLFSLFLGKYSWFAGEKLTFVDFLTYDVLDQNRMFEPKCLDEFPNLKAFMCRFEFSVDTTSLYVVLRIEPGLHTCQANALPLEPHPQLLKTSFKETKLRVTDSYGN